MAGLVRYNTNDVVNDTQNLTISSWTNNTNALTTVFSSSTQADFTSPTSSGAHFIDVYNLVTTDSSSQVQYSVAYGHRHGSGALDYTNDTGAIGNSPSKVIYNQYRQLVYGDENSFFNFNGVTTDDIYVININRARYRHNLKAGSLNLKLKRLNNVSPTYNSAFATNADTLHLTDDSVTTSGSATITNAGRQFTIVSGSSGTQLNLLGNGTVSSNKSQAADGSSGSYGFFYPDAGFMILNPQAISCSIGFAPSRSSNVSCQNHDKFAKMISHGGSFILDSQEKVSSQYYFTRARNYEFNYTTNPSYIDTTGNLNYTSMIDNPTTYITTVGLYNDAGDLVAVAKLSQPVVKDFTKEALIRVKLDY